MKHFLIGVSILASATATFADTLSCKLTNLKSSGGYIPSEVALKFDIDSRSVEFLKPKDLVDREGDTVEPELITTDKGRLTFKTIAKSESITGQKFKMNYRLTWIKKNNKAIVQAIPLGYSNRFRASGICQHQAN